jgi:hypothetical protein
MYLNKILAALFVLLSGVTYSQQIPVYSNSVYHERVTTANTFFDQKYIYPAHTIDTNKLRAYVLGQTQWMGSGLGYRSLHFSLGGKIPRSHSYLAFDFQMQETSMNYQLFHLNYAHSFKINNYSGIIAGINLFSKGYKINEDNMFSLPGIETDAPEPLYLLNADVGLLYYMNNHNIGISYLNLCNTKFMLSSGSVTYTYKSAINRLALNYFYHGKVASKISLTPGVIVFSNFDDVLLNFYSILTFNNGFSTGLSFNTDYKLGMMLSGVLFDNFKAGYCFNYNFTDIYQSKDGIHGLYLSFFL